MAQPESTIKSTTQELEIALELYFERSPYPIQPLTVSALCGYVDRVDSKPFDEQRDIVGTVIFSNSETEYVAGWVTHDEVDFDATHHNRWQSRQFGSESVDLFSSKVDGEAVEGEYSQARVMIIGNRSVEAFFSDLLDRAEHNQTAELLVSASALAVNRLRRSATSLDPSPAALGDIRYYIRTKANTEWAERDPKEYAAVLQQTRNSIDWHVKLQSRKAS